MSDAEDPKVLDEVRKIGELFDMLKARIENMVGMGYEPLLDYKSGATHDVIARSNATVGGIRCGLIRGFTFQKTTKIRSNKER